MSTLDLEREIFLSLLSLYNTTTNKKTTQKPNNTNCQQRKKERDLSLHSLSLIFSSSSHPFFSFFFKSKTSFRKGRDTKNAPPKIPLHFFCNQSSSSSIIMGARSEIAMGGADVMTFVRSMRPGFPEGLKVRLFFTSF